ncbi:hypothetical protein FXO38_27379 [Capsicum annuum]|nr:hypothetical protein FXO38_27379 [Capsicum annuum]KAF3632257.1 hypothetical protein FXO37_27578 [Capsicum annuum]
MNQMRDFSEKWISDVSPMAIEVLAENSEYAAKCVVRFNGDIGFDIGNPPYTHVVNVKRKQCSCRSWQLKEIPCAHVIAAMHYKEWNVESFVDHWYQRETYLKAYDKYIQPMTNIKMWPKSTRPLIELPEITPIPRRPGKNRKKAKDEPFKKKFEKATRKGRKMSCSVCKRIGHNKKGCPTLKKDFSSSCGSQPSMQASTSTAATAAAERDANVSTTEEMDANAKSSNIRPTGRPANAHSEPRGAGRPVNAHNAPRDVGRPTNAASVGGVRLTSASTTDISPAAGVMPTTTSAVGDNATQSTTQQSTSGVGIQKRKTSTVLRGGVNLAYKRPRQKKLILVCCLDQVAVW